MALDLLDKNPFTTVSFGQLDTDRAGFTFDPDLGLDLDTSSLALSDSVIEKATAPALPSVVTPAVVAETSGLFTPSASAGGGTDSLNSLYSSYVGELKGQATKDRALGATLKTAASAGEVFTSLLTLGDKLKTANQRARNTELDVANKMAQLDNQVLYYKNQITDKFAQTMARNAATMAVKNLRVTAGNILEQTKDAAYDATKDIETLESNVELKKIALRSEARQAQVVKKLAKSTVVADTINSIAKLGVNVATGGGTMQSWGDIYKDLWS